MARGSGGIAAGDARSSRRWQGCACAALAACVLSCAPKSSVEQGGPDGSQARSPEQLRVEQADAERLFADIVVRHNARVGRLETFESRASLELRYTDTDGKHFDQCEADIFLASGGRGAVRATKVGNNLLWVGSDGTRGWVFLLDKDPTSLIVHDRIDESIFSRSLDGRSAADRTPGSEFMLLAPQSVRALAGMRAVGSIDGLGGTLRRVEGAAVDAPLHERFELMYRPFTGVDVAMRFDAEALPTLVRVLDGAGRARFEARLSEYEPAQAANLAQGAWPKVPRRIEVDARDAPTGEVTSEVRIYLDAPVAMGRRMKPRLFVLEELTAQLRPDSVQHVFAAENGQVGSGQNGDGPVGDAVGGPGGGA